MRNRVKYDMAYDAVQQSEILSAIASVLSGGGIAEVKLENRQGVQHITVVDQSRELIEDLNLN